MKTVTFLSIVITLLCVTGVQAAYIEVNSGSYYGYFSGMGTGRGQGILANQTFSVNSIGIQANLTSELYDIVIYSSSDGHTAGDLLAINSAVLGGTGAGWNDIPINFTFVANSHYVVNFRPNDGTFGLGYPSQSYDNNTMAYYHDDALPITIGPLTLIEGIEGYNAQSPTNTLNPDFRYQTVPIPAAVWLLGSGLLGLLGFRRKIIK
jgi:hypothetical protein